MVEQSIVPIKKTLELNQKQYYLVHLSIINTLLPVKMTPKQTEVIAAFMSLTGEIAERHRFGTTCRKVVMEELGLSPSGLTNYIKDLIKNGFLLEDETTNEINILPLLIPQKTEQRYMLRLINKDEK